MNRRCVLPRPRALPSSFALALVAWLVVLVAAPCLAVADDTPPAKPAGDASTPPAPTKKKKKKPAPVKPAEPAPEPQSDVYGPEPEPQIVGPQLPQPTPPPAAATTAPPAAKPFHFGRGRFLFGVKFGGLFAEPFGGLGASFLAGVELGWALPKLPVVGKTLALVFDLDYSQPGASGTIADPRLDGGGYTWKLTQRELMLGIEVVYRATWIKTAKLEAGKLVPYVGVGPRIFFLQTVTGGTAAMGGGAFSSGSEQSTRVGVGVPLGVEYAVGPGRVVLELMLVWAGFNHDTTGPANAGALTLDAGYRFLF